MRPALQNADILLLPEEKFRDQDGPFFPGGTEEFLQFLQEKTPSDIKVDIYIADDNYREVTLHHDVLWLGGLLVTGVVFPIMANLIAGYIKERLGVKRTKTALVQMHIAIEMKEKDSVRTIALDYNGPASEIDTTLKRVTTSLGTPLTQD
jgi:hypothetical protein